MCQEPFLAFFIRNEESVASSVRIRQDGLCTVGNGHGKCFTGQVDFYGSAFRSLESDLKALRPKESTMQRVFLTDFQLSATVGESDVRHTLPVHPNIAESGQIRFCLAIEDGYQVVPSGIAVSVCLQVFPDAFLISLFTHDFHQFLHHDGSLVVDDVSVNQSCIAKIVQRLADGVAS